MTLKLEYIIAITLFVAGVLFLSLSISGTKSYRILLTKGEKAIGKVSEIKYKNIPGKRQQERTMFINFTTKEGQDITFKSGYSSSSARVGDTITVYYMPDNPYNAEVKLPFIMLMAIYFIIGAALLCILLSLGLFAIAIHEQIFFNDKSSIIASAEIVELKGFRGRPVSKDNFNTAVLKTETGQTIEWNVIGDTGITVGDKTTVRINIKNPKKFKVEI